MLKRLFICQGMTKTSNQEFIIFIFLLLLFLLLLLLLLFIFIIFHLAVLIDVNFFVYTLPLSKLYVKKKTATSQEYKSRKPHWKISNILIFLALYFLILIISNTERSYFSNVWLLLLFLIQHFLKQNTTRFKTKEKNEHYYQI